MNRYNNLPSYHYEQETFEGGVGQISPASPEMRKLSIYGAVHKNLIKYPYLSNGDTINGVTFTVQDDGAIFVQGTATADTIFTFQNANVKAGVTYTLSGCPSGGSLTKFYLRDQDHNTDTGSGKTFTPSADGVLDISVVIISGTAMEHYFYPQLEKGTARTPYAKYTKQLLGQKTPNIFYWPFEDKTEKGITYEINKDNPCEIHIYGTATEQIKDTIAIENIEANQNYIVATNIHTSTGFSLKCNNEVVRYNTPKRFKTNSLPLSPLILNIVANTPINFTFKVCIVTLESIEWDFYKRNNTETNSGIKFTFNNDASITLNGTSPGEGITVYHDLFINRFVYFDKEYPAVEKHNRILCAMLCSSADSLNEIDYAANNLNITVTYNAKINGQVKLNSSVTGTQLQMYCQIPSGATFDNLTVYPHFYYMPGGDYLYDYGYETLIQTVTEETKDVDIYPYTDTTKTVNGITFTDNGDGSITMNGTATDKAEFVLNEWPTDTTDVPFQYNTYMNANKNSSGIYLRWERKQGDAVKYQASVYNLGSSNIQPYPSLTGYTDTIKIIVPKNIVLDNLTIKPRVVKKWSADKHHELRLSQKQLSADDIINDESIYNLFSNKVNNILVCSNYNNLACLSDNYNYTLKGNSLKYDVATQQWSSNVVNNTITSLISEFAIPIALSGNAAIANRFKPISTNNSAIFGNAGHIYLYNNLYSYSDKIIGTQLTTFTVSNNFNNTKGFLTLQNQNNHVHCHYYFNFYANKTSEENLEDFKFKMYITPLVKGVYSNVYGMDNPPIASSEVIVEYYKY